MVGSVFTSFLRDRVDRAAEKQDVQAAGEGVADVRAAGGMLVMGRESCF